MTDLLLSTMFTSTSSRENAMKSILESKNISLSQLSDMTGISLSTLKSFSSGRRDLRKASFETLDKIAQALDVDVYRIVGQ